MDSALLISRTFGETRVALLRNGVLEALRVERADERGSVGNVYVGRVLRVLPGMQAAFVEIGLDRAAFLYVGDALPSEERAALFAAEEVATDPPTEDVAPDPPGEDGDDSQPVYESARDRLRRLVRIEELLSAGDKIIVQVTKDPLGGKGARITRQISLPGRFLVYLPGADHVGVSRRIIDPAERERLRAVVEGLVKPTEGFIVRTACADRTEEELAEDVSFLRQVNQSISDGANVAPPACLHRDLDAALRAARDLLTDDITRVILDDPADHGRMLDFVERFLPRFSDRVELWAGDGELFQSAGVERHIDRALNRKVHLKSGAHLVFDPTEALTAIDVNTGRFVGKTSLEDTIVQVNLEAARAIPEQLKVRGIGGLIVVDFIDMVEPENRQRVFDELVAALKDDRARTSALPISEFGLAQITRHRVRDDLSRQLMVGCTTCGGAGRIHAPEAVAYSVLRAMRSCLAGPGQEVVALCSPAVAGWIEANEPEAISELSGQLGVGVRLEPDGPRHSGNWSVSVTGSASS
jgi:ribonuclease G